MKDERGETPLNREARKREWKAVEELVVRGADPNLLDKNGYSVLNMAIVNEQWGTVWLLIECLGNIHKSTQYGVGSPCVSPLQLLIDKRQGELIDHTLMWCPDQAEGVNDIGESALHTIALDKRPELMYYQVVRGVNPITLTQSQQTTLLYAVKNTHCPQRMVAECIRLGFSTHQPAQNGKLVFSLLSDICDFIDYNYDDNMFVVCYKFAVSAGRCSRVTRGGTHGA
jgi:hypothetical protein